MCLRLNCSEDQSRKCRQLVRGKGKSEPESAAKFTGSGKFFNSFFAVADSAAEPPNTWLAPLQLMCALYPEVKDRKRALKLMMRKRRRDAL